MSSINTLRELIKTGALGINPDTRVILGFEYSDDVHHYTGDYQDDVFRESGIVEMISEFLTTGVDKNMLNGKIKQAIQESDYIEREGYFVDDDGEEYDFEEACEKIGLTIDEDSDEFSEELKNNEINSEVLKNYLEENKATLSGKTLPKYFYEIEFEKPGGIVMPIIVEYSYADGSKERVTYPVQVWRKNPQFVTKRIVSNKEIVKVVIDPKAKTADVNLSNNSWPKEELKSDFDKFKDSLKG